MKFASLVSLGLVVLSSGSLLCGQAEKKQAPQDSSWLASAGAEMARAEYRFNPVKGEADVWSAPNRAHELRSRVSERGLEVFSRTASADGVGAPWRLQLATKSFGRVEGAFELASPAVSVECERVELDHGALVEWFENTKNGIEQGWTIAARPIGAGELWIGLEFGGDLSLRIEDGARSAVLVDACGEAVLRYKGLMAFDATGRELEARLVPIPEGVGLTIDDVGADYPVTVDPVLTGPAWTAESDKLSAQFGYSVASAGDVNGDGYSDVIVGARWYNNTEVTEGRGYVFLGSVAGLATTPSWTAESGQVDTWFGYSVACAGDVNGDGYSDIIVGAIGFDNFLHDEGRAYVYLGSPTGLSAIADWAAEGDQADAWFGSSVAGAGDVNGDGYGDVIIGAWFYDNGEVNEGRAFLYLGSNTGLSSSAAWTAESDQANANFGNSVATAGDVNGDGYSDVIVGAFRYDNSQTDEGRAYLFLGSGAGLSVSANWTAESDQAGAWFGKPVATAGDVNGDGYSDVIVGAEGYENNGQTNEGHVFVYLGSGSGLSISAAWAAESDQAGAEAGGSAATAGDVNGDGYSDVVVGAIGYDNGLVNEGGAFLYLGSGSGLSTSTAWVAEGNQLDVNFGNSVATAGDVNGDGYSDVIAGAYRYNNGQADEGRAYVYHGSPTGLRTSSTWSAEGNQTTAGFGSAVASAGDVNGDGYADVLVSAPLFDDGETDKGRVFVYKGSVAGALTSPSWELEVNQAGARFGTSLASAGDVNGDGYADVLVGARLYDNIQTDEGGAFLYQGSPAGLAATPSWSGESNQAGANYGGSVASAGDVNGDGYGDVIVGASQYDNGQANEGRAYVYLGSSGGLATSAAWSVESDQANAELGTTVSLAGDVNGDGYGDVIVGVPAFDNGESDEGRAYAYQGSAGGLSPTPDWTGEEDSVDAQLGRVAAAGDVNGDGYSDVIVGAPNLSNGESGEGAAFVYLGSPTGLAAGASWMTEGNQGGALYGVIVSGAGDVNGDGYSDVLVGANSYDAPENNEGRAYLYLGSANGVATSPAWSVEADQDSAILGPVSSAGDVNGDGYGDVIVGAAGYDNGETDEGRAWIYLGNEGRGGLVRRLQQRTKTDLRPLAVVGRTADDGLFRIRCEFPKNAAGFSWASPETPTAILEWEVKPLGVAFDGTDIQRSSSQSLVPAGGTLTFDEFAVANDARGHARITKARNYHWRARVATNSPLFPHTAWFSAQGNNITEAKIRKPKLDFP